MSDKNTHDASVTDLMSPRLPDPVPSLVDLHRVREPGDRDGIVRLNRNERQYPLPDWFVEKMAHSVTSELLHQLSRNRRVLRPTGFVRRIKRNNCC